MKTITIITPTYNMEDYLEKCLSSIILPHRPERVEAIVVNDGSKDGSLGIARRYAEEYPDIFKVIDKPNGNYGSCINAALPTATGRYVKVLDADDTFDTDEFEKLVDFLDNTNVDMVITDYRKVSPDKEKICRLKTKHVKDEDFGMFCKNKALHKIMMHFVTYRLDIVKNSKYRQTEGVSYSDNQWVFTPLANVKTVSYIPLVVYKYLMGREGQTMTPRIFNKRVKDYILVICNMLDDFDAVKDEITDHRVRKYMHTKLYSRIRSIYKGYLLKRKYTDTEALEYLEEQLKTKHQYMYEKTGKLLLSTPILCFRYVNMWRDNHNSRLLKLIIYLYRKKKGLKN